MAKYSGSVTGEDDETLICANQVVPMLEPEGKPDQQKLLATVHKLGSPNIKVGDKIRMLTRLLEIPSSSITEQDVIRMLAAETRDLVNVLVLVVNIYTGTSAENRETLLAMTLEFFNKVLGTYFTFLYCHYSRCT